MVAHGVVVGDYWVSNKGTEGADWSSVWDGNDPQSNANVSIFLP